ncbi:MAG: hypothetical protein LBN71_08760 [Tannerella sp.]|nr:hypothetical protein [Tannerella sp.]
MDRRIFQISALSIFNDQNLAAPNYLSERWHPPYIGIYAPETRTNVCNFNQQKKKYYLQIKMAKDGFSAKNRSCLYPRVFPQGLFVYFCRCIPLACGEGAGREGRIENYN